MHHQGCTDLCRIQEFVSDNASWSNSHIISWLSGLTKPICHHHRRSDSHMSACIIERTAAICAANHSQPFSPTAKLDTLLTALILLLNINTSLWMDQSQLVAWIKNTNEDLWGGSDSRPKQTIWLLFLFLFPRAIYHCLLSVWTRAHACLHMHCHLSGFWDALFPVCTVAQCLHAVCLYTLAAIYHTWPQALQKDSARST